VCQACSTPWPTFDLLECCTAFATALSPLPGQCTASACNVIVNKYDQSGGTCAKCNLPCQQVAAAEQQSLQWEAYASGAANAVRWHDASKDAARGDAFGAALAGNAVLRPQVTRAAAAGADTAGASMFDGTFTGSVIITGRHTLKQLPTRNKVVSLECMMYHGMINPMDAALH
jgi:hypothetical protein